MADTKKKKGRPTKAELEKKRQAELRQKQKEEQKRKHAARVAAASVLLFALGVFLLALTLIEGERAWLFLHGAMFGLFGPVAYAVGPIFIYIAIVTALERERRPISILYAVLLLFAVCGTVLIFSNLQIDGTSIGEKFTHLYNSGKAMLGGGIFSAVFGWSLLALFGKVGAAITIIIIMVVLLMLLTGKTVVSLAMAIGAAAKRSRERRLERREQREREEAEEQKLQEKEEQKKPRKLEEMGIDIPLPGEKRSSRVRKIGTGTLDSSNHSRIDIPLDAPISPIPSHKLAGVKPVQDISLEPIVREKSPEANVREYFDSLERENDAALDAVINRASEASRRQQQADEPVLVGGQSEHDTYRFPPLALLNRMDDRRSFDITAELRANADKLVRTLESFGVKTKVVDISRGPTVTRYELQPNQGVKVSRISSLSDDIALNLATAGVRIEAPIPNKSAVGIEVPNREKAIVSLRSIVESREFRESKEPLTAALGKDIDGRIRLADITKMPHMLVAGATNSGKSVCLNSIIISVFYKATPQEVRLILIDPKSVELIGYNGVPHLLVPVVTDPKKASGALAFAVSEMMKRYKLFAEKGVKNLESYNKYVDAHAKTSLEEELVRLPRILIVIDELSDLMMAAPNEVEDSICRLAQLARAAGIHLIVATQRPSVDVVTGLIKANIPTRVAFAVSSQIDSRTILGAPGAEKLLGRGDMLFQPMEMNKPVRLQGCFVSEEETAAVVKFIKDNSAVQYNESVMAEIERNAAATNGKQTKGEQTDTVDDAMLESAVDLVVEMGQASTSMLQRKLRLGYARAARIVDEMELMGIVGPADGAKPRAVLIGRQQWLERKQNKNR